MVFLKCIFLFIISISTYSNGHVDRYYLLADFGSSKDGTDRPVGANVSVSKATSYGIGVGYRTTEFGMFEGFYKKVGNFEQKGTYTYTDILGSETTTDIDAELVDISLLGFGIRLVYHYISARLGFLKAKATTNVDKTSYVAEKGSGGLSNSALALGDQSGGGLYYAVGLNYALLDRMDLYLDYNIYRWGTESFSFEIKEIATGFRFAF